MNIVFSNHAKYRLNERKISVADVKQAIKNPSSKRADEYGMMMVRKNFSKKSLEVVYKVETFVRCLHYSHF